MKCGESLARCTVYSRRTAEQVQLRVFTEGIHNLVAIQVKRLADIADLIRKGDLQRMKTIRCILNHLGFLDAEPDNRRVKTRVEAGYRASRVFVIRSDDRERR